MGSNGEVRTPSEANDSAPHLGRRIGDFVLREPIGTGGFGDVYRARQLVLEREAVVKVQRNVGDANRFLREAQLASKLDHPYAAHIYAFGVEPDGLCWLAMELVRGTTLGDMIAHGGPLQGERFLQLMTRVCEVVDAAHGLGIVHRDLKPQNIMVVARGGQLFPKLVDFGLARLRSGRAGAEREWEAASGPTVPLPVIDAFDKTGAIAEGVTCMGPGQDSLIGTPGYMAPEQWLDPEGVDPRTDVYALTLIAYETMTGRKPFLASTALEYFEAHRSETPPPLGEDFPAALDEVILRGLAKDPADRYASAAELGEALSEAIAPRDQEQELPPLPVAVLGATISRAPQPIAEAVARLEAANDAPSLNEATRRSIDLIAHYLGVLALASEYRMRGPKMRLSSGARERLESMLRGNMSASGWLGLARELCAPLADVSEAAPIPELAQLVGGEPALVHEAWQACHQALLLGDLAVALEQLASLLEVLQPLFDYGLAVRVGERLERWTSLRRESRPSIPCRSDELGADEAGLVTALGTVVLPLWPFVHILRPTPEREPEVFLFEGLTRRGARFVAGARGFQRFDELPAPLLHALRSIDVGRESEDEAGEEAPYLGLHAFTNQDADRYYGREREVEIFVNRLRLHPMLAVVGPSGAGKSSFVHAGVLPRLPKRTVALSVRPGAHPLEGLGELVARVGDKVPLKPEALRSTPSLLADRLLAAATEHDLTCLLVIDQFEELLTLTADPADREAYAQALCDIAHRDDPRLRVILTLRDDFLMRARELPGLEERFNTSLHLLGAPALSDLERILVEPLRHLGYRFEDDDLVSDMVAAVAHQPGALALLSFTARRLWERRDRQARLLTRAAYVELGGVGGALAHHADDIVEKLPPVRRQLVRELFRHLVTPEGTRAIRTRAELRELVGPEVEPVLEELIRGRLLLGGDDGSGDDRIEVIHEALIARWPRLEAWRQEDAEGARMREQLRIAAKQWDRNDRIRELLWGKELVGEFNRLGKLPSMRMTKVEQEFLRLSRSEVLRWRRRVQAALLLLFAILAGATALLYRANNEAQDSARNARKSATELQLVLAQSHAERGRQELIADHRLRAATYLSAAFSSGLDTPAVRFLLGRALSSLDGQGAVWKSDQEIHHIRFSKDGKTLLSAGLEGAVLLWDVATGKPFVHLPPHDGAIRRVARSDRYWATGGADGRVWISTIAGQTQAGFRHKDVITDLSFAPDGNSIASASADGELRLSGTSTGEELARASSHVAAMAFAPSGKTLLVASFEGDLRELDARTLKLRRSYPLQSPVTRLLFLDETTAVTGHDDGIARVWNLASGTVVAVLRGHDAPVTDLAFHGDPHRLATSSADGTVRLWSSKTWEQVAVLRGHQGKVSRIGLFSRRQASCDVWLGRNRAPLGLPDGSFEGPLRRTGGLCLRHRLCSGRRDACELELRSKHSHMAHGSS